MAYVFQEFSKWKYHRKKGGVIVQSGDEERALGRGWADLPFPPVKPSRVGVLLRKKGNGVPPSGAP